MSASSFGVSMATLLSHREWVRRVACTLIDDETVVDDVEQRTWMAALTSLELSYIIM